MTKRKKESSCALSAPQSSDGAATVVAEKEKTEKRDDVEQTIDELRRERAAANVAIGKRPLWLRILMIVFFPVTGLWLLSRKIKLPLVVKMTGISTLICGSILVVFSVFLIRSFSGQLPDTAESGKYLDNLTIITVILTVTFVVLFAALAAVTSQLMLNPIRRMTQQIDEITSDNLSARLDPVDSQDELRELTNRINEMLNNLQQSFERQQNFVADASHELKTPIAVIRGYSSLLKRWGSEKKDILDEGIDAIARESDNMKRIVEQLLLLARLGNYSMSLTRFNLAEVIADMSDGYRLVDENHTFTFAGDNNITVEADKNLIMESVRTLVDNAIKYTPEGGSISVSCRLVDEHAEICVSDTGIGISEQDLPHIFERFYRCDKARGREGGGSGLGLTIAKSIVETMGGKIVVSSELNVGTTFKIILY